MTELRERKLTLVLIFGAVFLAFIIRLFYLQIISTEFAAKADNNAIKKVIIHPARGIIFDRKGRIYVTNIPLFELMVTPRELVIGDTSLFEKYLHIPRQDIMKRVAVADSFSPIKPSVLVRQISAEDYTKFQEHLWQFKGIEPVVKTTRTYRYPVGANFLGYISEVTQKDIFKNQGYYRMGDNIGRTGLEAHYEPYLRGKKGVKMILEDVHGRIVGPFAEGKYDTLPQKGEDIMISVDVELQAFGEKLMENKIGSIVAIEPSSGEILAFVSSPNYDPNLLSGTNLAINYHKLEIDSLKPLFNRPLQAQYPPGSIFKLLTALVALRGGTMTPATMYGCAGGFMRNGGRPACHGHPAPLDLYGAIQHSCNAYFSAVYVDHMHHNKFPSFLDGFKDWYNSMSLFGIGHPTGIDIPNERKGLLPSVEFYNKWYKPDRWKAMTILSNAIGQGEILLTPLQMANIAALIANKGYYIQPHFFKKFNKRPDWHPFTFDTIRTDIPSDYFTVFDDAMEAVVTSGTGTWGQVPGVAVCAKTGTAQNPHGKDHSVYIAYAPKDNPKIALSIIVENGGWGGEWAAPMAALVIEKYLTDTVTNTFQYKRITEANLMPLRYVADAGLPAGEDQPAPQTLPVLNYRKLRTLAVALPRRRDVPLASVGSAYICTCVSNPPCTQALDAPLAEPKKHTRFRWAIPAVAILPAKTGVPKPDPPTV